MYIIITLITTCTLTLLILTTHRVESSISICRKEKKRKEEKKEKRGWVRFPKKMQISVCLISISSLRHSKEE